MNYFVGREGSGRKETDQLWDWSFKLYVLLYQYFLTQLAAYCKPTVYTCVNFKCSLLGLMNERVAVKRRQFSPAFCHPRESCVKD